jgi:hypothetical protein
MVNEEMAAYQTNDLFSFSVINNIRSQINDKIFHPTKTESEGIFRGFSMQRKSSDIVLLDKIGKYALARKLIVEIIKENDFYISKNDEFNIWGEGRTPREAIKSLGHFMLYDYNSYRETPLDKLDLCARRDLKKYEYIFQIHNVL